MGDTRQGFRESGMQSAEKGNILRASGVSALVSAPSAEFGWRLRLDSISQRRVIGRRGRPAESGGITHRERYRPADNKIASGRSAQIAVIQARLGRMTAGCPQPTVARLGSGRYPGTLDNEKLPFGLRLRYCWVNGPYAAVAVSRAA